MSSKDFQVKEQATFVLILIHQVQLAMDNCVHDEGNLRYES